MTVTNATMKSSRRTALWVLSGFAVVGALGALLIVVAIPSVRPVKIARGNDSEQVVASGGKDAGIIIALDQHPDDVKNTCEQAKQWWEENEYLLKDSPCNEIILCDTMQPRYLACLADPLGGLVAFETRLKTEFALCSECSGLEFAILDSINDIKRYVAVTDGKHLWNLVITFDPGTTLKQSWLVNDDWVKAIITDSGTVVDGDYVGEADEPAEIARKVCRIARQRGAATDKR